MTIDWHDDAGYRIFAAGYGSFCISAAADRIDCAPASGEHWRWQRYLLGQVLPITSVLNGSEPLHASSVAVDGRAVAFVAGTGVGKTSLALNMVLRGHRLMSDDVVALSLRDGAPFSAPGPAVANLREAESSRIGARLAELGAVIGQDKDGLRVAVRHELRALPLGALYLLDRADVGETVECASIDPDFRVLFANSFDFLVTRPKRMRRQLEVFGAIAAGVPTFRLSIPPRVHAGELAEFVERHLQAELT